jgi:hypothetical protein
MEQCDQIGWFIIKNRKVLQRMTIWYQNRARVNHHLLRVIPLRANNQQGRVSHCGLAIYIKK